LIRLVFSIEQEMISAMHQKRKMNIHPFTMITWSQAIGTFEALPEIYQPFIRQLQYETGGELPYMVLTPATEKTIRKTPEQIVCSTRNNLYVIENIDRKLSFTAFPIHQIHFLEVGAILLFSWLTIHGMTTDGVNQSKTIEFNSVSFPHFLPFINQVRGAPPRLNQPALDQEKRKFYFLAPTAYKFMNYGCKSLMGNEKVLKIIWEPEIREKFFPRLRIPFSHLKSNACLSILTDKELILVQEFDLNNSYRGTRYGGIWRYIPHRCLNSVRLSESNQGKFNLTISLAGETEIQVLFRNENRPHLDEFIQTVEGIIEREVSLAV
jgi:hypothetical protein